MILGKRHLEAPRLGLYVSLLVSAIALALTFPVLAQAEECTSSSCVQYDPGIPRAEGGNTPTHHKETPAKVSKTGSGGETAPAQRQEDGSQGGTGGSEGESSPGEGGVGAGKGDDGGQSSPGGSGGEKGKAGLQPHDQVSAAPAPSKGDGGSSPLVPILIAVLVLAGISVAVVMLRQRRRPSGPSGSVSPEAG